MYHFRDRSAGRKSREYNLYKEIQALKESLNQKKRKTDKFRKRLAKLQLDSEFLSNVTVVHFVSDGPCTQYRQKSHFYLLCTKLHQYRFQFSPFRCELWYKCSRGSWRSLQKSKRRRVSPCKTFIHFFLALFCWETFIVQNI